MDGGFEEMERQSRDHLRLVGRDYPVGYMNGRGEVFDGNNWLSNEEYHAMRAEKTARDRPFKFVAVGDLEYKEPEFLIDGLIETDTLGMIFGDPGCGKSFVAVDLALCVASGTPFHDRSVKQGSVFFIAGEGHNGLARRFHAWSKDRGVTLAGVPMFKSERAAQFLDGASAAAVAQAVDQMADQFGQPSLIIVDTVARNFGPGDENSTHDMGNFIAAIDDLKARYPGAAVLLVHHSGHADKLRARGAMALKGALDAEFRIEKNDAGLHIHNTKMKDGEEPPILHFQLTTVALDAKTTSAVLEPIDAPERQTRLTPAQRLGIETYSAAAANGGVWDGGAFKGVHVDEWRDQFYSKHTGDNQHAKKVAFQRVRADLVRVGKMRVQDDVYLIRDDTIQPAILEQRHNGTDRHIGGTCADAEADMTGTNGTHPYRGVPCAVPTESDQSEGGGT